MLTRHSTPVDSNGSNSASTHHGQVPPHTIHYTSRIRHHACSHVRPRRGSQALSSPVLPGLPVAGQRHSVCICICICSASVWPGVVRHCSRPAPTVSVPSCLRRVAGHARRHLWIPRWVGATMARILISHAATVYSPPPPPPPPATSWPCLGRPSSEFESMSLSLSPVPNPCP